jgi:acyl carrier protein
MPDYNEYLESIYSLLQPFLTEGVSLTEDTELVTELGLTSLQVMTMIEHIEDHFDISIPLNILPEIRTVRDLAQKLVLLR